MMEDRMNRIEERMARIESWVYGNGREGADARLTRIESLLRTLGIALVALSTIINPLINDLVRTWRP